jgi:nucleoid-associated protein YgaU
MEARKGKPKQTQGLPMDSLGTGFDALLTRGALALLVLAAAWALAVVVAVALEARTQGRVRIARHTGCPPAVRLWLLALFTAVLAGVAPAQASDRGTGGHVRDAVAADLDGLPLPDRTVDPRARHRAAPRVSGPATDVVVERGDSLWRITEQRLPPFADDAAIATVVAAVYAANRAAIGPDPDLIEPGQHLVFPAPPSHPEEP